jgi:UDP-N-acetylmuramoyl-tripeptide--D-alanyl-D-alanine ligase
VITAIGPVHLERFKSEGRILEAKSEITVGAEHVVLPVDDARLAALADQLEASGRSVVRVSGTGAGDDDRPEPRVVVTGEGTALVVSVDGAEIARVAAAPPGVHPRNLACAVGVAVVLGIPPEAVGARVATLGGVEHRLHAVASDGGFAILDDTYNSNPSGAAEALRTLVATEPDPATGTPTETVRRVVVTPGMVELGERQGSENRTFAAAAAAVASDLVVVGRTNRRALVDGARSGRAAVTLVADRQAAVDWVRRHLGPGDVVLYENDLPDHYP